MNDFFLEYTINTGITTVLMAIKNPKSLKKFKAGVLKVVAAGTVMLEQIDAREELAEAIEKERAKQ